MFKKKINSYFIKMENKNTSIDSESNSYSDMQSMIQELNYLHEISQRISEKKNLDLLLREIMESCKVVMNAEASSLLIYDEKENKLFFDVATGEKGEVIKKISLNMGEGIAGWVAEHREPLLIEDCYEDPRFNREFDRKSNFRTKSMICVPMIRKEKLIGVIQVINKKDADTFTNRDLNVFKILASQCAISIENARLTEIQVQQQSLERELKTARAIQQNLLPSELPEFPGLDVSFKLVPARQVGGDYYNVYKIDDSLTLFFICDVSGKSISAALIVSTICSCILTYMNMIKISKKKFDLLDLVKSLNRVLIDSTTDEKFVTCWFGLYDHSSKKLMSINAGHNTIYVFRNNIPVIELKEGGIFLGCMESEFKIEEIQLEKNDLLVCYTDGVPEAMNKNSEFYGDDKFVHLVHDNLNSNSGILLEKIYDDLKNFVDGAEASDDITCGVIRVL